MVWGEQQPGLENAATAHTNGGRVLEVRACEHVLSVTSGGGSRRGSASGPTILGGSGGGVGAARCVCSRGRSVACRGPL